VTVNIDFRATEDEIRAVADTLAEFDLQWPLETGYEGDARGGIDEIPTLIQFAVAGFAVYFSGFLSEAGRSTFQRFGEFVARLRTRRQSRSYMIEISDQVSGHVIHIGDNLPAEAIMALETIDFDNLDLPPALIYWDSEAGRWAWLPRYL
jgi:hypothetical protein